MGVFTRNDLIIPSGSIFNKPFCNIPGACLLNRPPVPAMDLKRNSQACDITC